MYDATGQAAAVRPGKPSYRAAFENLSRSEVFSAQNELALTNKAITSAQNSIKSASDELVSLSQLFSKDTGKWIFGGNYTIPIEISAKVDECLQKIHKGQEDLVKLAEESKKLKESLRKL